jgi:hypothetical protein
MGHPLAFSLSNGDALGPLEFYGSNLAGEIVAGTGAAANSVLPRRPAEQRLDDEPLTLGDVVEAVVQCSVDSREASMVIENLLANGRVRLTTPRGRFAFRPTPVSQ